MPLITLPSQIADVEWTPPALAEYVSKSGFSGKATIINRGGVTAGWRAQVTVAARSESDTAIWKAFAALARSKANVFRLPAVPSGLQAALPVTIDVYGSGQHVNQLLHNNALTNAAWSTTGLTSVAANTDTTPAGVVGDSFTLLESATSGAHGIQQSLSGYDTGKQYCFSIWARSRNRSKIGLVAGSDGVAVFDLSAGTVTSNSGVAAGIIPDDFGWYRCWMVFTPSTGSAQAFVRISDDGNPALSYLGNDAFGVSVWRPQIEYGMRPTPGIINGASRAASVRAIDVIGLATNTVIATAGAMLCFYDRLHLLTGDLVTGASGVASMAIEPPLARNTAAGDFVFARSPFCRMRMVSESAGWADRLGYGEPASFECEEAL